MWKCGNVERSPARPRAHAPVGPLSRCSATARLQAHAALPVNTHPSYAVCRLQGGCRLQRGCICAGSSLHTTSCTYCVSDRDDTGRASTCAARVASRHVVIPAVPARAPAADNVLSHGHAERLGGRLSMGVCANHSGRYEYHNSCTNNDAILCKRL
jgi:hypothetical protein